MTRKFFRHILMFSVLLSAGFISTHSETKAQSRSVSIVAVVNNDIISANDLKDRMKLVMSSSGLPNNDEIRTKITPQILKTLIDESLKQQEAQKYDIDVSDEEIERGFSNIAAQNKIGSDQFKSLLRKEGVSVKTLENQIKSEILWGKLVSARLRSQIEVSEREIDNRLNRLQKDVGKTEYRLFEIFLGVDDPSQNSDVNKLANKFYNELQAGRIPFQRLASQVSQSSSAARGGDLGWLQENQMAPEVENALKSLDTKQLSKPIRALNGYYIVFLLDKRTITEDKIPLRDDVKQQMSLERLDRLQRQYLLDLKSEAFIEQRV